MNVVDELESQVRNYYCRTFPTVFESARGLLLYESQGRRVVYFFNGAGVPNYGHAAPVRAVSPHVSTVRIS